MFPEGSIVSMNHQLRAVRVYDLKPDTEGFRILVDRLWPRGKRKEDLGQFEWAKDIAPSNELRKWFGHDPGRFEEFARRYREELDGNPQAGTFSDEVRENLKSGDVLLLFGAKDKEQNQAVVLKAWLEERLGTE